MLKLRRNESIYVLAVWSGRRRYMHPKLVKDCTFYLRSHIDSLHALDHNLSKIVVSVAHNPRQPIEFTNYLNNIPKRIKNAEVEIVNRENKGMSYGALSNAYALFRTNYDYYFFIEDDYLFAQNNFDALHIEMMKRKKCAYLCAAAGVNGGYSRHAMISTGCLRSDALENLFIRNRNTLWPYPYCQLSPLQQLTYGVVENLGQFGMSRGLLNLGYTIEDVGSEYISQWRGSRGSLANFHDDRTGTKPIMTTFAQ